ncbi:MAG TPA: ASKHA domain-containing protein [Bryobacteraceae bacterium]|nr:ASKHA domain-containing protein [Bryobacteraceae bacterium]
MDDVSIRLEPLGKTLRAPRGGPLQDILFSHGMEFPCGGQAICKGCRVRLMGGSVPPQPEEAALLAPAEIEAGWRLACRLCPQEDITLEIARWETPILVDDTPIRVSPREGLGVAVDLGTTTLVAQLVDLASGHVLGVRTSLNPQAAYGSDVMSRIDAAVSRSAGPALTSLIRARIGELVAELLGEVGPRAASLAGIVLVGNTVMHHLFCGYDVEPLARVPFRTDHGGEVLFRPPDLGWPLPAAATVRFLPCLGGFVGSDILAGILATRMHESETLVGLVDLGTNAEIVFGDSSGLVCASSAAGPAFEGGLISSGMRATGGAVFQVRRGPAGALCRVLGDGPPRGICGSGLVDAAAVGLDLGVIHPNGRLAAGANAWMLLPPVSLTQSDIRALQLAKGAIAAGMDLLLARLGAAPGDVSRIYLAGAFGNYVDQSSARRIGLIGFPREKVSPAGNTALLGARLSLFEEARNTDDLLARIRHIPLAEQPGFQDAFAARMAFPASAG